MCRWAVLAVVYFSTISSEHAVLPGVDILGSDSENNHGGANCLVSYNGLSLTSLLQHSECPRHVGMSSAQEVARR